MWRCLPFHSIPDPRTAGVRGDRINRRQLSKRAPALFRALEPGERVMWALGSLGMRPKVGALTESRLLLFPLTEPDGTPEVLMAPYTLQAGKKKILGQAVTVRDVRGARTELLLSPHDHQELCRTAGTHQTSDANPGMGPARPVPAPPGRATAGGSWQWTQPVLSWEDAERMAADHMRHLGFSGVIVTPQGRVDGLDVVSQDRFRTGEVPCGSLGRTRRATPAWRRRRIPKSAVLCHRLRPGRVRCRRPLGRGGLPVRHHGGVVAADATARQLVTSHAPPAQAPERGAFGQLTREARQQRAIGWAQQVQAAAETPISNRKRKGARQLAERQRALRLMVAGLAQLEDSENPLYKNARKEPDPHRGGEDPEEGCALARSAPPLESMQPGSEAAKEAAGVTRLWGQL